MMATPPMVDPELEELREAYKQATDEWVIAIRAEESLATPTTPWWPWSTGIKLNSEKKKLRKKSKSPATSTKMPYAE
jgi:hypothetical protein